MFGFPIMLLDLVFVVVPFLNLFIHSFIHVVLILFSFAPLSLQHVCTILLTSIDYSAIYVR